MHVVALTPAGVVWNTNTRPNTRPELLPEVGDTEKEDCSLLDRAFPGCGGSKQRGS